MANQKKLRIYFACKLCGVKTHKDIFDGPIKTINDIREQFQESEEFKKVSFHKCQNGKLGLVDICGFDEVITNE